MRYRIGVVTGYLATTGQAIVDLVAPVYLHDHIQIGNKSQTLDSIQIEHEKVDSAKEGDTIVIKPKSPVSIGEEVIKEN